MTLEGDTLFQIKKCWDAFLSAFFQTLSNNKSCPLYKYLISKHYNIYYFILPPDTYPKFSTTKEKYEAFSRALRVDLVKDKTFPSSKSPKSYIKLITYMNNDNAFDLLLLLSLP